MRRSTSTWSKGLVRKSDAPTRSARCLVSLVTSAVSTRMGRQSSGGIASRELAHHLEAVDLRHHQVEQDQVRRELAVKRLHRARVGRGLQVRVARAQQDVFEQRQVGGFVVHDEDFHRVEGRFGNHGPERDDG